MLKAQRTSEEYGRKEDPGCPCLCGAISSGSGQAHGGHPVMVPKKVGPMYMDGR